MLQNSISQAQSILRHGGVIAYSTETVLGLGCDPLNQNAVKRICWLKDRAIENGLIVVVENCEVLQKYSQSLSKAQITQIKKSKNTTWLIPKNNNVPIWVTGSHDQVAVRISDHSVASALSSAINGIISTSANISSYKTLTSQNEIRDWFGPHVDYMVINQSGSGEPSKICDLLTGKQLR